MSSYNKQQTVLLLPLPFELADIVNSSLFYDAKTGATMNFIKAKKKEIMRKFEFAYCSRKHPHPDVGDDPDNCENWGICLIDKFDWDSAQEPQFQAVNCQKCGNYKLPLNLQEKITCSC